MIITTPLVYFSINIESEINPTTLENPKELEKVLEEDTGAFISLAKNIEAMIKRWCPIETGRLVKSILAGVQSSGKQINMILFLEDYGLIKEFGSSRVPARPFIRPALDSFKKQITELGGTIIFRNK
jgi:hypothetical protein